MGKIARPYFKYNTKQKHQLCFGIYLVPCILGFQGAMDWIIIL